MTTLLDRPPLCPIHAFMLFLDELAQEIEIKEVSLWLVKVLCAFFAFFQFETSKSGPKNWLSEYTSGGLFVHVRYITRFSLPK